MNKYYRYTACISKYVLKKDAYTEIILISFSFLIDKNKKYAKYQFL